MSIQLSKKRQKKQDNFIFKVQFLASVPGQQIIVVSIVTDNEK